MRELGQVALCQSRSVCGGGYDFNEGRNRMKEQWILFLWTIRFVVKF